MTEKMNIKKLPKEDQEMLEEILEKDPTALTDEDKAVMRARSGYLTEAQLAPALEEGKKSKK